MKRNTLIIIMALLSLVWGAGFILAPKPMWAMYGISLDAGGAYISRELGTIFFMLGLILWFARKYPDSQVMNAIVLGLFVGNVLGFVVTLIGQFSTSISLLGWVGAGLYAILAAGFGYYAIKPAKAGKP
jgi:hypothetical protein